ncbi:hypothetical protein IHV10_19620 [Fictibacillus sp. 5RED26]|uniref:hypothetical protein n=1 Tax=unclassified Fictibacillus TaxID=2644029 RepID=UPI0018CDDF4C|nr:MULTISPECIES: hypothetical protein [unclassified Fictibacillus]MBH0158596.1 hypothetical protein [Fictibacillus sp. 5RED26]MBH0175745.1 hypothetical protein [Fictibacillus sp. 23RED33]
MNVKGEKIWVTGHQNENKTLKINSVTKNDKQLEIYSIIDVYNKQGIFEYTYIFQMQGEKEKGITINSDKPLTILTKRIGLNDNTKLKLNQNERKQVKKYVFSKMKLLQ